MEYWIYILGVTGTLVAIGKAVDGLLLNRHIDALDDMALRLWVYLDGLRVIDIPRRSLTIFLTAKRRLLGKGLGPKFWIRVFAFSLVVTSIAMPIGRGLGLYLTAECNRLKLDNGEGEPYPFWHIFVEGGIKAFTTESFLALVSINIVFDLLTAAITVVLVYMAAKKGGRTLTGLIALDIVACVALFHMLIWAVDHFDGQSVLSRSQPGLQGILNIVPTIVSLLPYGCGSSHFVMSKLLFASTLIIPTTIYLSVILVLALLKEGLALSKWLGMHVLERSVEDEKKSIVGHVSTSLALLVAVVGFGMKVAGVETG